MEYRFKGGEIKRGSFSCAVQPGFLAEAAKKANGSGRDEWNSERLSRRGHQAGARGLNDFFVVKSGFQVRLSLEFLSKATRLNISRMRLRRRLPYFSSSSEADRLVVAWVGMPFETKSS